MIFLNEKLTEDETQEQVAQRSCGISIPAGTQNPISHGHKQPVLTGPALSQRWTSWLLEVPSNQHDSVSVLEVTLQRYSRQFSNCVRFNQFSSDLQASMALPMIIFVWFHCYTSLNSSNPDFLQNNSHVNCSSGLDLFWATPMCIVVRH